MREKKRPTGAGGSSQESSLEGTGEGYTTAPTAAKQKRPRLGSQRLKILEALECFPDQWVGVDLLARLGCSAATHSQIAALRTNYGFRIVNKQERAKDGRVLSYYRLEGGQEV